MALVSAKCTNCGANLEVDNTKDAAICSYCGSAFVVEKAINNYYVNNSTINIQNIYTDVENQDFQIEAGVLVKYRGTPLDVTIPEGVKIIGEGAFSDSCVTRVTIPEGVLVIRENSFWNCQMLSQLNLPDTLIEIQGSLGSGKALKFIKLPPNLKITLDSLFFFDLQQINMSKYTYIYMCDNNRSYLKDHLKSLTDIYIDDKRYSPEDIINFMSKLLNRKLNRCINCCGEMDKGFFSYRCKRCHASINIKYYDNFNCDKTYGLIFS